MKVVDLSRLTLAPIIEGPIHAPGPVDVPRPFSTARRAWILGGDVRREGSRLCLRCTARVSPAPVAECFDFDLLHSLCEATA